MLSRLKYKLSKFLWRKLNMHWKLRSGIDIRVECFVEWVIYNDIFADGEYDFPINEAIRLASVTHSLSILDLGANVGFFALRAAHIIHKAKPDMQFLIRCVEGSPSVFQKLKKRIEENPHISDNISLCFGLLGQRSGSARIAESDYHGGNSVLPEGTQGGVPVQYVDISGFYEPAASIDLLKCDIEGAELLFLENYRGFLQQVRRIVMEMHYKKCDKTKCLKILKDEGFIHHRELFAVGTDTTIDYFWKDEH